MRKAWIVLPLLVALAGCNFKAGGGSTVTTVVDHSESGGEHLRLVMTNYEVLQPPNGATTAAAYVTIANEGNTADRLVSAACTCSASAHLHTMMMQGDQMVMDEPSDGFPIAPGQSVVFTPGRNHIMLVDLKAPPKAGTVQNIMLTFEKAGAVQLAMPVMESPQE